MEDTRRKRTPKRTEPQTRSEFIVTRWRRLGRPAVGARELSAIQAALQKQPGNGFVESPAAIARVLADEGAELRHPEVIECDAAWRAAHIDQLAKREPTDPAEALTLAQSKELIEKLERLRSESAAGEIQRIRSIAIKARETAQRHARRKALSQTQRAEQIEIAEWLGVWIKTPNLFKDWLELRLRSVEFRSRFPTE
ncbi:MAG TPA: hypothetical protein VJT71_17800 [Pyrinomonadaceae bacterium]|nr:hypothetical protein [Pyrinomonadaceae bacterium]